MPRRPTNATLLGVSLAIHLALIVYADRIDSHPEKYGGLRYTDVDWRVVSDGAKLIFHPTEGNQAAGWLSRRLHLPIGDPYNRSTFRYTPLLPLILSPTLLHPILGKLALSLLSLGVPLILLSGPSSSPFWPTHLLWTLNPFVLNITTRGSPEAIIVLLVAATLACLRRSSNSAAASGISKGKQNDSGVGSEERKWEMGAAVMYALAVSWKIYPVIYAPAIWAHLAQKHGWLGRGVWLFGSVALSTLVLVNGALWSIWGQPFLQHTFLYHLSRLDHRHNFSPYYYPIYLSFFPSNTTSAESSLLEAVGSMSRHPLASFLPQAGIVALAGFLLTPTTGLDMALFVQTTAFVIFNKVCTSQYFTWFIPLIPAILPRVAISRTKAITMIAAWVAGQAAWLGTAYQLEFLGASVHRTLWMAGLALMVISTWIIGEIIDAYRPRATLKDITGVGGKVVAESTPPRRAVRRAVRG